jgi:peroxiredoxin
MRNLKFKERLYCLVAALLFSFAVCGNNLYAVNEMGSGNASTEANESPQSAQVSKPGIDTKAPGFTLTSIDGKSVSLADYANWFVVINFWASSSPDSRRVNAEVAALEKKYKGADVVFISIALDENKATWQAAVTADGLTGVQLSELKKLEDSNIAKLYGVSSTPAVFILNPDGVIINIESGNFDLTKILKDLFGI